MPGSPLPLPDSIAGFLAGGILAAFWLVALPARAASVVPPRPLEQTEPEWPKGKALVHDLVVPLVAVVSREGTVTEVRVETSLGADYDRAAVATVRTWRFSPALSDGKPVSARIRVAVRFLGLPSQQTTLPEPGAAAPVRGPDQAVAASSQEAPAPLEVEVSGEHREPIRSASETTRGREIIEAAPHRTGGDLLQIVPGVFITQHSGQGKAYQVFYRGFDAVHGQDLEFWVGGAPVNEVSNVHGQGYADLHFVMPEVVDEITVLPGNYSPEQGDFAVAGTVRYHLGYAEPGVTAKVTRGSFGEQRVFLGYHPKDDPPEAFAAFELQSTDGFGPARAARRGSGIAQEQIALGHGKLRVLLSGYAASFDSPGVVRLKDLESGALGRYSTYGVPQGGFSSRYQWVTEYRYDRRGAGSVITPYVVIRDLRLTQNYTGYLVNPDDGDTTQLINESTTVGFTAKHWQPIHLFSKRDQLEAGISVRNDWISQSQIDVGIGNQRVLSTIVDAKIRALDAAAWTELAVHPVKRLSLRAGLRADGLAYGVSDETPSAESRPGSDPNAFSRTLRPPSQGGQARTAVGSVFGPRATVDGVVTGGLHALVSYGEGFRSPQARSLGNGEKTPFTSVRSMEAGLRYRNSSLNASVAAFRTSLTDDLVFDAVTTRNEPVPASLRWGAAIEFVARPTSWFASSASGTWTRATFTESDGFYQIGDRLPYVPELVLREDLALVPYLGQLVSRRLTARLGTGLTGIVNRPQPYGGRGHNVFLVDVDGELRLGEVALGLDVFNLLDADWYDSEFTYSANWDAGGAAHLVPERYVTVGAPRTVLATLSLFID